MWLRANPRAGASGTPTRRPVGPFPQGAVGHEIPGAGRGEQVVWVDLAARRRLGSLYVEADYPDSLDGLFAVSWDYPAIEPPSYLVQLSPELYRRERERVAARFEEAVRLAEEAFRVEFARLVSHLAGRLSGADAEGRPLVFRDTAVTNLREFFDRFRSLSVRSDADLDALVAEAQRVVQGLSPQDLRDESGLRRTVATQLARVQSDLEALLVDWPNRSLYWPSHPPHHGDGPSLTARAARSKMHSAKWTHSGGAVKGGHLA
jgi:hypothetical protein